MKVKIIFFSQTKNTRQIAQAIAEGISNRGAEVDLVDWLAIKDEPPEKILGNCDLLGIGTPVFFYQLPFCIRDWLRKFPSVSERPYFLFATYAVVVGTTFRDTDNMLRKKGWQLLDYAAFLGFGSYQAYLPWPRLSVQFPDAYEETKARQFGEFQVIKHVCFRNGKRNFLARPAKAPLSWRRKKMFLPKWMVNRIHPAFVLDTDKCIGCGTCAQCCPDSAITMVDNRPVFSGNCSRCYLCEKNCSQNAIMPDWNSFRKYVVRLYEEYPDYLKYSEELRDLYTKHPNHR
ncbi:MAG: 4Fe-4S binding protein [Nitrospirae bacterium]|nr:4Fe-4S binding protein [Nitrospirota bacterium]